jgi:drug/metabolite transporter (DMT)-like permease
MGLRSFFWILFLAALWGPSFLFIKVAVAEIPPLTMVTLRVGLAFLLLYLILRMQGKRLPKNPVMWRHFAIMAFVANALPFVLFGWGELYIGSALASVLNGTTPIFTVLLAHIFTTDDRMNPIKVVGVLLGLFGIVVLFFPYFSDGIRMDTLGILAITLAAFCYGISILYSRKYLRGLPPLVAPAAQLLVATLYLIPLMFFIDHPLQLPAPSWQAVTSLLGLSFFGTAIAFVVYYHVLEMTSATNLSMVTYLIPVIGVILGVVFLNEKFGWNAYLGCALILLGVMVVNGVFNQIFQRGVAVIDVSESG